MALDVTMGDGEDMEIDFEDPEIERLRKEAAAVYAVCLNGPHKTITAADVGLLGSHDRD